MTGTHEITRNACSTLETRDQDTCPNPKTTPCPLSQAAAQLTHRELVCLQWVAEGKSAMQIASHYNRTLDTINHHLKNAYRKLGARSRLEAVVPMIRAGLLPRIENDRTIDWDTGRNSTLRD